MNVLSKSEKYFIIQNTSNCVNHTITIINLKSGEALTASVICHDKGDLKQWILLITSTISDECAFYLIMDNTPQILEVFPKVEFIDNTNNEEEIKISFIARYATYNIEIKINDAYTMNGITYRKFMDQFMNECRVISNTTPRLALVKPITVDSDYPTFMNNIGQSDCNTTITNL